MSERLFRMMDGAPAVPWRMVEPYEQQALDNHGQTLQRLHERGGLAAAELWCIVHGKKLRELPNDETAVEWLKGWIALDQVAQTEARIAEALHARAAKHRENRPAETEDNGRYFEGYHDAMIDIASDVRAGRFR